MSESGTDRDEPPVAVPVLPEAEIVSAVDPSTNQPPQEPVGGMAASGVIWLTAQKWAIRLFGFVTIALLTRLLTPEDFGVLAAASTVLPFFYILADLGFTAYLVQVEKTTGRMLSTAFWYSLTAGMLLYGVLWFAAPALGAVFGDPRTVPVLQALSLWVLVTAVGSVPMAILRREMRFSAIAVQGTVGAVIAQAIALVLAFGGYGVWALVAQSLAAAIVSTALAWISAKWRPLWAFDRKDLVRMARFGGQVLGVEFVAMLRAWGEAAVISSRLGSAMLGYMSIAQRLVQIVQDLTGSAIVPVTNVAFAKIRESKERLRHAYLRALRMTYFVLSLPLTIVAVAAPLIIPIMFGSGWEQSYQVAQILAVAGSLSVGAWLDHGLYYAVGRPGAWFRYAVVIDALTLLTTVLTVRWGLVAIAWGFLGVATFATVVRWFLVDRILQAGLRTIVGPFLYLVVVVVCAGAAGWAVMLLTEGLPDLLSVVAIGATIVVVHLAISLVAAKSTVAELARMLARSRWGARLSIVARMGTMA